MSLSCGNWTNFHERLNGGYETVNLVCLSSCDVEPGHFKEEGGQCVNDQHYIR